MCTVYSVCVTQPSGDFYQLFPQVCKYGKQQRRKPSSNNTPYLGIFRNVTFALRHTQCWRQIPPWESELDEESIRFPLFLYDCSWKS